MRIREGFVYSNKKEEKGESRDTPNAGFHHEAQDLQLMKNSVSGLAIALSSQFLYIE